MTAPRAASRPAPAPPSEGGAGRAGRARAAAPQRAPEDSHLSPELVRARELLEDGRWHDYETVMRELVRLVTPGRAGRAAEQARLQHLKRRARQTGQQYVALPRLRPADPDRVRESGARLIVRKMLSSSDFEIGWAGRPPARRIRWPRSAPTRSR